jgi:hypothetical protein
MTSKQLKLLLSVAKNLPERPNFCSALELATLTELKLIFVQGWGQPGRDTGGAGHLQGRN